MKGLLGVQLVVNSIRRASRLAPHFPRQVATPFLDSRLSRRALCLAPSIRRAATLVHGSLSLLSSLPGLSVLLVSQADEVAEFLRIRRYI